MPDAPAVTPEVAMQAADWFVRLTAGRPASADRTAFQAWLAASPAHAQAWQRATQISQQAGALPADIASPLLRQQGAQGRRKAVRTLALLIAAAPGAWLAWRAEPWRQWTAQHATATGEQRELALDDGSRVVLDTASAIDVLFSAERRAIRLRAGAILATTAPDPKGPGGAARPFIVLTGQGQARALGTRFAVRQQGESSHVAVFEGAVALTPLSGGAHTLSAGEQASFSADGVAAAQPLPPAAGQWARGVLAVEDMRLADFAAELARYRPGLLQCDPAVAHLRITGAFQLADTDAVLRNIEQLLPVQARQRTRYWVTLVPR